MLGANKEVMNVLLGKMISPSLPRHRQRLHRWSTTLATDAANKIASIWSHVPPAPEDAILGLTLAYEADSHPLKVNLGVGAYRDDDGAPVVLPSVREAERRLLQSRLGMEYLPVAGDARFRYNALRMALCSLDDDSAREAYGTFHESQLPPAATVQTLSGTGALRLAAEFLRRFAPRTDSAASTSTSPSVVCLPQPTWSNHPSVFRDAGLPTMSYRYYDGQRRTVDIDGMLHDLVYRAPPHSVVLLHACAHNPTGTDLNRQQWQRVLEVFAERRRDLLALFDMAYQGFATGDADRDAAAVRSFVRALSAGREHGCAGRVLLVQSFSKNFGVYGHRVGALTLFTEDDAVAAAVESQLKLIARPMYSNPPLHGARLVNTVLEDAALTQQWRQDVRQMADRIRQMRAQLRQLLEASLPTQNHHPSTWSPITDQVGMFCYSGLQPEQVNRLRREFHVYLTRDGRISMAGVTRANVAYLAHALATVTDPKT
eukprot:ctg_459.g150